MFAIKKIISSFLLPPGVFAALAFAAAVFFSRRKRGKTALALAAFSFALWFFSSGFISSRLSCLCEDEYLKPYAGSGDVIVVLGGGISEGLEGLSGADALDDVYKTRLLAAYRFHRKAGLPVIVTGGGARGAYKESMAARELLLELGVDKNSVYTEERSRDTRENAVFSRELCDALGFSRPIVVTDAGHMRRSLFAFRSAGFADPQPLVSGFSCSKRGLSYMDFLPGDFEKVRAFFYENLGLVFYRLRY